MRAAALGIALFLSGCARIKIERLSSRFQIPEPKMSFQSSREATGFEVGGSLAYRSEEGGIMDARDTLKYDSSGTVMGHPRRLDRIEVGEPLRYDTPPLMASLRITRLARRGFLEFGLDWNPEEMEVTNAHFQAGACRTVRSVILSLAGGFSRMRLERAGIYHSNSPSHTDLEEVYIRHTVHGSAWTTALQGGAGLLWDTPSNLDPYLTIHRVAFNPIGTDLGSGGAGSFALMGYRAGLRWMAVRGLPVEFSLALQDLDSPAEPGWSTTGRVDIGWRFQGPRRKGAAPP